LRSRVRNRERRKQVSSVFLCVLSGKAFGRFALALLSHFEAVFPNKMCGLQTFTNFPFPPTIFKEQYDLLAETSSKNRSGSHSNTSNVLRRSHSDLRTLRSSYA